MNIQEDQAAGLRRYANDKTRISIPNRLRCIGVGSGKGGVGKTMISVGLSYSLVRLNYRVLLLDADLGLANADIQMGIDPDLTLQDVVFGDYALKDILVSVENGPDVLPSSSGAAEMADMGDARRRMIVEDLIKFSSAYDYLIIDVGAGISKSITTFLAAAPEVIVVVANEPGSIMDAYSLIKCLQQGSSPPSMMMVVNMVRSLDEGEELAIRLNKIIRRFLNLELPLAGIVTYDECVGDAVRARSPIIEYARKSGPAQCLEALGRFIASPRSRRMHTEKLDDNFFDLLTDISVSRSTEEAGADK